MKKKQIYKCGSGELNIEFDGEYFIITQDIYQIDKVAISTTKNEIEEMLKFAKEVTR